MIEVQMVLGGPQRPANPNSILPSQNNSKQTQEQWRLLIVEDELLVAENIKELLTSEGYEVVAICSSGEEAIPTFKNVDPDLVLMDIRLSGPLNGIQTAALIQELKEVPILFLTAYGEELIPEIGRIDSKVFDLVTKPYDKTQIVESIRNLLKGSGRTTQ